MLHVARMSRIWCMWRPCMLCNVACTVHVACVVHVCGASMMHVWCMFGSCMMHVLCMHVEFAVYVWCVCGACMVRVRYICHRKRTLQHIEGTDSGRSKRQWQVEETMAGRRGISRSTRHSCRQILMSPAGCKERSFLSRLRSRVWAVGGALVCCC